MSVQAVEAVVEAMDFHGRSPYLWSEAGVPRASLQERPALMPPWHSPWGPGVGALLLCPGGFSWGKLGRAQGQAGAAGLPLVLRP